MDHAKLKLLMDRIEPTIKRELEGSGLNFALLLVPIGSREISPVKRGRDVAVLANVPAAVLRDVCTSIADDAEIGGD